MQSAWRVACVRIPRFPIGALWDGVEKAERGGSEAEPQLELPMPATQVVGHAPVGGGSTPFPAPSSTATHWDDRPIALVEGERLRAVTAGAGRAGVRAGMSVTEARARCAGLAAIAWDDVAVDVAITKTTAALLIASPQVTPVAGAPGMWWVGAGGLDGLGGERSLVRTLLRVARLWHPRARVSVAGSCVAARAATWGDVGVGAGGARSAETVIDGLAVIVPRGGCAAYLAPAPLGFVPMDDELRATLQALGLRTVGALAALEAAEVERRWGEAGLAAWRLARGEDRRRPVLAAAEARRLVSTELAMPAETMEPVLFLVRAALDRLVREVAAEGRAAVAVAITVTLDDGRGALPAGGVAHTVTREVRMARGVARVAPLFERCRALLDRWVLSAPVAGVAVAVTATEPLPGEQGHLLDPAWRDPAAVEAALERLRAELGPNVVVRPIARDEHRPERAGGWVEAAIGEPVVRGDPGPPPGISMAPPPPNGITAAPPAGANPNMAGHAAPNMAGHAVGVAGVAGVASTPGDVGGAALRLLEVPEPVEVECAAEGEAPSLVWWRGRRILVRRAEGPERLSGEWWRDGYRRDYWRCEGAAGDGDFVLYRDRAAPGAWYLQGWYD